MDDPRLSLGGHAMNAAVPGGLVALALCLGAGLAYQVLAPVPQIAIAPAKAATRAETSLTLPVYQPPPEEEFAIVNARHAFNPTRQPVAEPAESGVASASPPDVTLVGVAIGPQKSVALLKMANAVAAVSAVVGQTIDGWQLVRIEAGSVVFHAHGTDYTVALRAAAGLAPPGAGRVPPGQIR
jgi:hypothetical protein